MTLEFADSNIVENCFIGTEETGDYCVYHVYVCPASELVTDDKLRDSDPTRTYETLEQAQTFLEGIAYSLNFGLENTEEIEAL